MIVEIWKDIENFKGLYQVSNFGKVKSFHKTNLGNILKAYDNGRGYLFVHLCKDGKRKYGYIHKLVAKAFLKNPKKHTVVNQVDGNRKNNKENNLEWCTQKQNMEHASRNNLILKGERCHKSKLKNKDVVKIRKMYKEQKITHRELGKMFKICPTVVSRIINKKIWKHLKDNDGEK